MHRPTVKSAKPLTKREREWLNELERVMRACPSTRLACYTIGDKTLYFYNAEVCRSLLGTTVQTPVSYTKKLGVL